MEAYTDIEQSKKLAEILPIESADMCYPVSYNTSGGVCGIEDVPIVSDYADVIQGEIPCWSLAALLGILPKIINHNTLFIETSPALWHIGYRNIYTARADNPVDACYEMIVKLHEQNLL